MGGYRNRYSGGGRYGGGFSLGFPPFHGAIKWLIIVNVAVYLLMLALGAFAPEAAGLVLSLGELMPLAVTHGWIWQLVTYSFLHSGLFHILFNMLTLWMFGATLEQEWGEKKFYEFYFFCVIAAALTTVVVAYTQVLGVSPSTPTIGASGGIFGVLIAFAMLHGDQQIMMFPLPFLIKARYVVAILVLIALAGALEGIGMRGQGVAYFAHLGGAFFGWAYVRLLPRGRLGLAASERYFGLRNSYYRWKRRRAASKFQVYMRQHDRSEFFDEHGNYRDPGQKPPQKGNGEQRGPGPWVN